MSEYIVRFRDVVIVTTYVEAGSAAEAIAKTKAHDYEEVLEVEHVGPRTRYKATEASSGGAR